MREELDPEVRAVIDDIERQGVPEWHAMGVESARRVEDEVFGGGGGPEMALVRNLTFDGPACEVPVRVYRPETTDDDPLPVLVYYHGGGWVLGTLDSIDGACRELAERVGCVVVSVDYRLAPEHPFPSAVDDAYAAVRWVASTADAFGGDPSRLGVAGTSAGATLAAVTALRLREEPIADLDLSVQLLLYPITNHAFDTDSYEENAEGYLLTRADMGWFWTQYLRSSVDGANPYASPLRARELSGLPPACVVTAGYDPLRDEGVAYAERLAEAGIGVAHEHYPSMCHGFLSLTDEVDVADEAMDTVATRVREHL
ncbi:alpha/beta hydrolase [Halomarina oriensis]|uniref:Alpha/beta hydrolase fold domain-containing protein n=1 Tax=Halomarina oriensis TaxID=671145 RepID=A0A6B0GJP1_9EURY|nr:alpha/beta hydrolase [Halomarina oriensis]MWG33619.1 alpha/beta hydrolase fold domain-containing protein [Halomarina oriensis]